MDAHFLATPRRNLRKDHEPKIVVDENVVKGKKMEYRVDTDSDLENIFSQPTWAHSLKT
jgi:hypothetical protein